MYIAFTMAMTFMGYQNLKSYVTGREVRMVPTNLLVYSLYCILCKPVLYVQNLRCCKAQLHSMYVHTIEVHQYVAVILRSVCCIMLSCIEYDCH